MQDEVVIPIRRAGSIMQVVRAGQVKGRLVVRVLVHGPGEATPLPMAVTLPRRCPVPRWGRWWCSAGWGWSWWRRGAGCGRSFGLTGWGRWPCDATA